MPNCGCPGTWYISGTGRTGSWTNFKVRGYEHDSPYLRVISPYSYLHSSCDSRQMYNGAWDWEEARNTSQYFVKDDPNCVSQPRYDCINGSCLTSSQYKTPGIFESLADCQANCGSNSPNTCPPGKVCLEQSEYSDILNKINTLSGLIC